MSFKTTQISRYSLPVLPYQGLKVGFIFVCNRTSHQHISFVGGRSVPQKKYDFLDLPSVLTSLGCITKCCKTGWLKTRELSHSSGGNKSKIQGIGSYFL